VNCQERTREELLETLRITLEFNKQDALSAAEFDFREEKNRCMKRKDTLAKKICKDLGIPPVK